MKTEPNPVACPVLGQTSGDCITLAHGEGSRLTRRLISEQILPAIENEYLSQMGDATLLPGCKGPLAMSTDSFVISPLFFPGGDIGSLAVYGTVNDLAVSGARPLWISLALIIEEGLPMETLQRVLASVAKAAQRVGVRVVTGDTKVVPRGAADQLFINTTGIGEAFTPALPGPTALQSGDAILVTGPLGRHGMAVMASREGLEFNSQLTSDCAPLVDAVVRLHEANIPVRAMRDATRGGVAAVLHEWAEDSGKTLAIDEESLPIPSEVRGICEVLGLDAIHVANEGTMVVAVPQAHVDSALKVLQSVKETAHATPIGEVSDRIGARIGDRSLASVIMRRSTGQKVPLDEPLGAPLPRIC